MALAEELLKNADIMNLSGGGVTFSGGEPLAQAAFLHRLIPLLKRGGVRLAIETSGYADARTYQSVISQMDFVYQDLKHHDAEAFRKWTGGELAIVLENISWLQASGVPHVLRIPVIPGVNDRASDRSAFEEIVGRSKVEWLPFNPAAGAKYPMLGRRMGLGAQNSAQNFY